MANDLVSVTLVTYNSGRFIRRCLESVLAQNYPNVEIVVIDNASNDGTEDILAQFEVGVKSSSTKRTLGLRRHRTRRSACLAASGF